MAAISMPVLGEATVQELREAVRGDVITPADPDYPEARRVWNGVHDASPAVVVRCTGAADVITAVGFARSNDLPIAVRGGGHSVAGFSTCDNGIVIDLSRMNEVRVDPANRRATVGGGAVWADIDHETQAHGLATTGGLVSTTGVAGFTLGGGIGWTMRKFGLACDNLVAADVVTADGCVVHANEDEQQRAVLGAARRRRQLRDRHAVRVRASPARPHGLCGADLLSRRGCGRPAPHVPRVGGRRAGRHHGARQPDDRAATAGDPGGVARQEGRGIHRRIQRAGRAGRRVLSPRSARWPRRSPTCSGRCRTA